MEDNVKNQMWQNKFLYASIIVVILIISLIIFGYKKGYRFQENFMIGKLGALSLQIPFSQTNIYIDENKKIVTTEKDEVVELSISPRNHTVMISRDGYYPWKKDISVESEQIIKLFPIFVSKNPSGEIISKEDPEFWQIRNKIIYDVLPTKNTPHLSTDQSTKMWIEDNAVMVQVASTTKTVIQPDPIIRNVYFYKDRSDVLILSVSNGVYAIEVNKEGTQNFLPIYKGVYPSFIEGDLNYIYVLDNGVLMQVII